VRYTLLTPIQDWEGNLNRIKEAIKVAQENGSRYVTTPELSIPGYGCLDHFLVDRELDGIMYDVGMPVRHSGNLYNARIVVLNGRILLIRPKMSLAMAGNYREGRYFIPWSGPQRVEQYELHELPPTARSLQDSAFVPVSPGCTKCM
jgi:NAD+ synthase (glutamine-hydrolysing)